MGKQIFPDDHPKVNGQKKGKSGSGRRKKNMEDLKKELDMDDHIIPLSELATRLQTSIEEGLDENFAEERLHEYGPNTLTPPKQTPEIVKLLMTFSGGFSILLWIGAIMCIVAFVIQMREAQAASLPVPQDNLWLAIVLAVVVILTGLFQYYQESKSSKIMNAFKKMIPYEAIVIRNGHQQSINAVKLVVGDIVMVKAGDRVPADIRVVSANDMKVDNSSLTGESEPQPRSGDCTNENPLETQNIAFFSTNVVEGTGKGVVIQTGDDTLMGRIAYLAAGMKEEKTTLAREIERLVAVLSIFAVSVGVLFCVISFILGYKWIDAIILFIGVVVANVPEGLLATVTVSLATAAKRMAGKNCLVKNLEAVETLGSTSTICSDKTGTLTQNRMTVSHLWYKDSIFEADLSIDQSMKTYDRSDAGWQTLLQCSMLCSRTEFKQGQEKITVLRRECLGDATESGLLRFGELAYGGVDQFRLKNKKVFEIPFNSTDKYQVSIHLLEKRAGGRQHLLVMKGAPERVIECCATILVNGSDVKLTDSWKKKFNDAYEILGGLGERVIGFCDIVLPNPEGTVFDVKANNVPRKGLRFVGLISLIDPPRPNVPSAVRLCRTAGIRVVMVTGDHPFTARAIARSIGLISETSETPKEMAGRLRIPEDRVDLRQCKARVVTGSELKLMSSSDLDQVIEWHDELVFARTSPQQKLIIVEAFQRSGAVVAVTGDGVNDSPALKKADIGVAMGIAGTDVTKQAAAMVLLDDNFASIVLGVEEGRRIFDNLKKSIAYTMAANIPELVPFLAYVVFSIPNGIHPIAILCIDIGTDIFPAISFAYEPAESDIMLRMPRNPKVDRLVTCKLVRIAYGLIGVIETIGGFFAYFVIFMQNGFWPLDLFWKRDSWDAPGVNDFEDSMGQEWAFAQRQVLESTVSTAFFVAILIMQWSDLLIMKTTRYSLLHHSMGTNRASIYTLYLMTGIGLLVCYCPGLDEGLGLYPLMWYWWPLAMPFAALMFIYDEIRKFVVRGHPGGWLDRLTTF